MIALSGYQFDKLIYESNASLVYCGRRRADNRPIILKALKDAYPSPEQIIRIKSEYDIVRNLALKDVVEIYALEKNQQRWVLIMEDFGGQSLTQLGLAGKLTLANFLTLAIRITDILGQIHHTHVIHKDVNPSNILVTPFDPQHDDLNELDQWSLKLTDFGISTVLSKENPEADSPNVLKGTLAYISPEQTGRMNRMLDYRTDFYSLGVTFYELLTGMLPFQSRDPLELVHCHIAKQPTAPHKIKSDIPPILSDIVIKLIAKNAEDRYQAAYGLKADLEECLSQWKTLHRIASFPLGQHDVSDKLQISHKLYGRELELEILLTSFIETSQKRSQMVLVSGYVGIGKSALVHELYKPITGQKSFFISGKFDQLQRNIPYAPLIKAFRSLVQQLLTESQTQIEVWKEKLVTALIPNGQVISKVIPEIELIIGPQPQVPPLGLLETRNRFNLVFLHFLKTFARPEQPLVIFLDDLQWADEASLKLIKTLVTAPDSQHILLIGAYRDNEVTALHPLLLLINDIKAADVDIKNISLSPLTLPHVTQLVIDALHCNLEQASPLAKLLLEKTEGNPYFLGEFLKSLYSKNLIHFDSMRGLWQWDLTQIRTQEITDNVIELMAEKIKKLLPQTQEVLKLASCIGHQFDLETLAIIAQQSIQDVITNLQPTIAEGLVIILNRRVQFIKTDVEDVITAEYKFVHDRVQQAVYSLISDVDKQIVHWRIGQLLLRHTLPDIRAERIFDLVNQLNLGRASCVEQTEWDELAELNLLVGQEAKTSAAYQLASSYFKIGIELVQLTKSPFLSGSDEDCWQRQYKLTLSLYVEAMEAAYLATDFEQMEQLAEVILPKAKTLLDKIKVYQVRMHAYIAQNKVQDALDIGLSVLKFLAVRFPPTLNEAYVIIALQEIETALAQRQIEELITLPEMTDAYRLATLQILSIVSSSATIANPALLPFVVFKMVTLSIEHGNAPESALAYADYGLILSGQVGDIDSGGQFGQLALQLLTHLNAQKHKARAMFTVYTCIKHWQEHVRAGLTPLLEAYRTALEVGDLEHAAQSILVYGLHSYFAGNELTKLAQELTLHSESITQLKQKRVLDINILYQQIVLNLMDATEDPCHLDNKLYSEEQVRSQQVKASDKNIILAIYLNRLILYYLFQEYQQAVDNAAIAKMYLDNVASRFSVSIFYFYDSLAHLAILSTEKNETPQKDVLKRVVANQEKLKKWAEHAPMNHLHKYYLVAAEQATILGQDGTAREYYDQAIALAQKNQYLNDEALANELAASFYLAKKQLEIADVYLRKAHYSYAHWGALAKVRHLETRYPHLKTKSQGHLETRITTSLTANIYRTQEHFEALDLTTVIKASQIMSGEIMLDSLLSKMMQIVIENAGAQKGHLILETEAEWSIAASSSIDQDEVFVEQDIPLSTVTDDHNLVIPKTIINYVIHSQETVVLNNASNKGQYTQDPYILMAQPKSVLCMPLITQGNVIGLLYLENNLTTGAFTSNRLEILNILSSQAAISIENARFYAHQIELTQAYSRFVPSQILQFLNKQSITQVKLGDQTQQEMTVLFADIRSFTNLSEQMTPQENFNFINSYLGQVSPIIREYNGFIDKYMGDAIMALFPTQANDAIQAAIAIQKKVTAYNLHRLDEGYQPINVGIGLHTGIVMLGTIGEVERMEGTVISDAVNLAARLEGLTKLYGSSIIVSGSMMVNSDTSKHYTYRFLDQVKVKGKEKVVSIFEILNGDPEDIRHLKLETQSTFEQGLLHYHDQKFTKAKKYFQQTLAINPNDKAAQLYLRRVQTFIEYGVPPDWEGVAALTDK